MGNGENLGAVYREGLSNERAIRAESGEVREGGDYVAIRLQEEPAEQRSQKGPGVLTCPGVCEGQGTRRHLGCVRDRAPAWSGLRTGVKAGLGTELGKVRLCWETWVKSWDFTLSKKESCWRVLKTYILFIKKDGLGCCEE